MATARRSLRTSSRSSTSSLSPATAATRPTGARAGAAATRQQPLRQRQAPPARDVEVEAEDADAPCCPICFDALAAPSKPGGRLLRSSWAAERVWLNCGHVFCEPCLSHHASLAVREGKTAAMAVGSGAPLECPMHGCNGAISEGTLKRLLSPADFAEHLRFTADAAVAADLRIKPCPQRRCQGTARLSAATLALLQASFSAPASASGSGGTYVEAVCGTCKHAFCCACGAASAHPGKTCEAAGDEAFFNWKRNKAVKPCPFCQYQVRVRVCMAHCVAWFLKTRAHLNMHSHLETDGEARRVRAHVVHQMPQPLVLGLPAGHCQVQLLVSHFDTEALVECERRFNTSPFSTTACTTTAGASSPPTTPTWRPCPTSGCDGWRGAACSS